jgi:hypothetical protein
MFVTEMYVTVSLRSRSGSDIRLRFEIGHASSREVVRDVDVNILSCVGACESVRPVS